MADAARAKEQSAQQVEAPEKDNPLLDLSDAAVKRFNKTAKARGYVTYHELNAVLPSEEVSSEQLEDTMSMLSEMGITVVETEDHEEGMAALDGEEGADDDEGGGRAVAMAPAVSAVGPSNEGGTDLYVRADCCASLKIAANSVTLHS